MPNRNYLRGRQFEYQLKKDLEENGWTVLRTAGSHGFADLIALKEDQIRFYQCKVIKGKKRVTKEQFKDVLATFPKDGLATVSHRLAIKLHGHKVYGVYTN